MTKTSIDRQKAFTGTRAPEPGLKIETISLTRYLEAQVEGFRGPLTVGQFNGGQSNPTYKIAAASGDYVLRRKPPGTLLRSAHAVEREFRVMQALGMTTFPVPKVHCLCEDPSVVGTAFYLMDYADGRIVWEPAMPDADRAVRSSVYDSAIAALADLHCLDATALGLADYGRGENYVLRQIKRWSEQYQASKTIDIIEMDRLMDWLPERIPQQQRLSIVHGDYRLDNIILDPNNASIRAIIDWELSTLGDPVADFTNFLMQWKMPPSSAGAGTGSIVNINLDELGIPTMKTAISTYEARTGLHVWSTLDFYLAYNFFRIAAILQGIVGRVRDGTATNPNASAMSTQVRPIAEVAWNIAQHGHGD